MKTKKQNINKSILSQMDEAVSLGSVLFYNFILPLITFAIFGFFYTWYDITHSVDSGWTFIVLVYYPILIIPLIGFYFWIYYLVYQAFYILLAWIFSVKYYGGKIVWIIFFIFVIIRIMLKISGINP